MRTAELIETESPRFRQSTRWCDPIQAECVSGRPLELPSTGAVTLPESCLRYWRLMAAPFVSDLPIETPAGGSEFYFRSESHVIAWSALARGVAMRSPVITLEGPEGSGQRTLLRQILASGGMGATSVEPILVPVDPWPMGDRESWLSHFQRRFANRSHDPDRPRALWIVSSNDPDKSARIGRWVSQNAWTFRAGTMLLSVGLNVSVEPENHFGVRLMLAKPTSIELARCLTKAMRFVGGVKSPFSAAAGEMIGRLAEGSFGRLRWLVHASLRFGHAESISQIRSVDLRRWQMQELAEPIEATWRRAG